MRRTVIIPFLSSCIAPCRNPPFVLTLCDSHTQWRSGDISSRQPFLIKDFHLSKISALDSRPGVLPMFVDSQFAHGFCPFPPQGNSEATSISVV